VACFKNILAEIARYLLDGVDQFILLYIVRDGVFCVLMVDRRKQSRIVAMYNFAVTDKVASGFHVTTHKGASLGIDHMLATLNCVGVLLLPAKMNIASFAAQGGADDSSASLYYTDILFNIRPQFARCCVLCHSNASDSSLYSVNILFHPDAGIACKGFAATMTELGHIRYLRSTMDTKHKDIP
jgi:hypothetical protein